MGIFVCFLIFSPSTFSFYTNAMGANSVGTYDGLPLEPISET